MGLIPVRIGAKLTDTPKHRGFFVVDRTRALEQLKQLHFLEGSTFSFSSINEDTNGNGVLDDSEDVNGDNFLDQGEDTNNNGVLDYGEDLNRNGVLDKAFDFRDLILHRQVIE